MVSEKTIRELIEDNGDHLITISMPTHHVGEESKQDPIRFKNLLSEIQNMLVERGMDNGTSEKMLKPAKELMDKPMFWSHQKQGLVVYLSDGRFDIYKLPYEVEEQAYVRDHYLIKPLLPMVSKDGLFSVLAVSRKNVRLLRCTRDSVENITPDSLTTSVEEYLEVDPQKSLQFHSGNQGQRAMYFGHNANEEDKRVVAEIFFKDIEKEITKMVRELGDPLILVGLVENLRLYSQANSYERMLKDSVNANPDDFSDKAMRDEAWKVVQHHFLSDMYASLEKFTEQNDQKVSNNLGEIIEATVMGKSGTIFISQGESKWGFYDDENHTVHYSNQPNGESVELLNWLSIRGLKTGSNVYILPKEEMPIRSTVAAEFRF